MTGLSQSSWLANCFGMGEVSKATSSCADELYKRLVVGGGRNEAASEEVVRV